MKADFKKSYEMDFEPNVLVILGIDANDDSVEHQVKEFIEIEDADLLNVILVQGFNTQDTYGYYLHNADVENLHDQHGEGFKLLLFSSDQELIFESSQVVESERLEKMLSDLNK